MYICVRCSCALHRPGNASHLARRSLVDGRGGGDGQVKLAAASAGDGVHRGPTQLMGYLQLGRGSLSQGAKFELERRSEFATRGCSSS